MLVVLGIGVFRVGLGFQSCVGIFGVAFGIGVFGVVFGMGVLE